MPKPTGQTQKGRATQWLKNNQNKIFRVNQLAEELGISSAAIRSAMRELEVNGVIELKKVMGGRVTTWRIKPGRANAGETVEPEKPKPCPFCGNAGVKVWELPRHDVEEGCGRWIVKCVDGCSVNIDGYISREGAIKAWNRRPETVVNSTAGQWMYKHMDTNGDSIDDAVVVLSKDYDEPLMGDADGVRMAMIDYIPSRPESVTRAEQVANMLIEARQVEIHLAEGCSEIVDFGDGTDDWWETADLRY